MISTLRQVAQQAVSMGHVAEAEQIYRRVADAAKSACGPDRAAYDQCLEELAGQMLDSREWVGAEQVCRQLVALRRDTATGSGNYAALVMAMRNLADLCRQLGKLAEATQLQRESAEIMDTHVTRKGRGS